MVSRRGVLAVPALVGPVLMGARAAADGRGDALRRAVSALERRHGGRLGVAVLDDAGVVAHRGDERFALCSTFKFLAAAFVLARVDRGEESLSRRVRYSRDELVTYSPVTGKHAGEGGLTVAEICDAAVTLSDNTAGNLLLDSFGGPAGLTGFMRSLGDGVSRLDRRETALNEVGPGEVRDTTTPVAMAGMLRRTVLGDALSESSRAQLVDWIVGNKTGDRRLRAGVPAGWRVGDKTGTGPGNIANDVAVFWPPGRGAVVVTAYYAGSRASETERDAVLAEVGRLAAAG